VVPALLDTGLVAFVVLSRHVTALRSRDTTTRT
jgi:hypothetical protein